MSKLSRGAVAACLTAVLLSAVDAMTTVHAAGAVSAQGRTGGTMVLLDASETAVLLAGGEPAAASARAYCVVAIDLALAAGFFFPDYASGWNGTCDSILISCAGWAREHGRKLSGAVFYADRHGCVDRGA